MKIPNLLADYVSRLGGSITEESQIRRFIVTIQTYIFEEWDKFIDEYSATDNPILKFVCSQLGMDYRNVLSAYNRPRPYSPYIAPPLRYIANGNYTKTLQVIEFTYHFLKENGRSNFQKNLSESNTIISSALISSELPIIWRDGKFHPKGADELDEILVSETLKWLEKYPKVRDLFSNALDNFRISITDEIKRRDAVSNAYQAVDEMNRIHLEGRDPLQKSCKKLANSLNLPRDWETILNTFVHIAQERGYHTGQDQSSSHIPSQNETEAFIYFSGILLREPLRKDHTEIH